MGEKIVLGPFNRGLNNSRTAFVIDNDSFPVLQNAYQWRGRIKRKRGTSTLGRLTRYFKSIVSSYSSTSTITLAAITGAGNLLTGFSLQTNGEIVPGSVTITAPGPTVYTDPSQDGTLSPSGTINYATGAIAIPAQAGNAVSAIFRYYPKLPVLGIEDLTLIPTQFPGTLAFDSVYSYNISTTSPYPIYDVSFYKNPATGTYPGYIQKTNWTPTTWNGNTYQQFWTTNYQNALWATNGIDVPFTGANIGMQFKPISNKPGLPGTGVVITAAGPPATADIHITAHGLVVGDFVFINEVNGITGINFQTGYVIAVIDADNISVEFPNATLGGAYTSGGIAQYLTNRSDTTKDCLRFYDGDPTNGNSTSPTFATGHGWVNFAPPLSESNFSISQLPAAIYYLVGARMILPFKDRLLFFGPVVQTSTGTPKYLQDTIVYSQNGTPYYTASYTNTPNAAIDTPTSATNVFTPILVPDNQTATSPAYFSDSTGFGGFVSAALDQPITTACANEDVIIVGLSFVQTKLVYSGNDVVPFYFYVINSEYGSASTFSIINMDKGVITRGTRGIVITSQSQCERIDLEIPDEVFEINLTSNGNERLCSVRDFINEWVYFTYPVNSDADTYPNQSLFYNYRDNSWAIFKETYTTYGYFRRQTGFTWSTVGLIYPSWSVWNDAWNAGESTLLQQEVLAGNQQGFILSKDDGTGEGTNLSIRSFSNGTNIVTSPSHNLDNGDYIIITGSIGTVSGFVDGKVFSIEKIDTDTFSLNPDPGITTETYFGGALITRIYVPFVQTKQFPTSWQIGRKTRLGVQQYLLTTTAESQITLLIFLSQNNSNAYNTGPIVPATSSINDALLYSTVLYTCPESTNLGLTPANVNLQMPTAMQQQQIWHRINTSLIGDTVQIGFTLSDEQIRDLQTDGVSFDITGITRAYPAVITTTAFIQAGQLVLIEDVLGMTELNGNVYQVVTSDATTVTIDVDSSSFTAYDSEGTITAVAGINAFAEIELHGAILDVNPSQLLV